MPKSVLLVKLLRPSVMVILRVVNWYVKGFVNGVKKCMEWIYRTIVVFTILLSLQCMFAIEITKPIFLLFTTLRISIPWLDHFIFFGRPARFRGILSLDAFIMRGKWCANTWSTWVQLWRIFIKEIFIYNLVGFRYRSECTYFKKLYV